MKRICPSLALLTLLVGVGAAPAFADPVEIGFNVTVRATHGSLDDIFGLPIHVGDIIAGSLTYDPAAVDGNPDPLYGGYNTTGEIAIEYGSGARLPLGAVSVINSQWGRGYPTDYFGAGSDYGNISGFSQAAAGAEFVGPAGIRTNDNLPATAAAFRAAYFSGGSFNFSANKNGVEPPWDDTTHGFAGVISLRSVDPAAVPEPASLLLVGTGALLLATRLRRAGTRKP